MKPFIPPILSYVISCFIIFGCGGNNATGPQKSPRPVRYGKIIQTGSAETQTFSGIAKSSQESQLSFKVSGIIAQIPVKVGDRVSRGQMIAQLDATDYDIGLEQAQAQLKSAQTQITSARSQLVSSKSNYERVEKLYENNSLPLSDYEQAKTNYEATQAQYDAAEAQVNTAQKQVDAAKKQVEYATILAPFNGVITAVFAEENEITGIGNPVATLSSDRQPEVSLGIPESFIYRIKKGQKADIRFTTIPDKTFKGTIDEVGFAAGGATTYPVTVVIDNPSEVIRPGMATEVTFNFQEVDTGIQYLIAPVKAVGQGPDGNFVFLLEQVDSQYVARKQIIEVGEILTAGFEVKDGLEEGQIVATAGLKTLLDGMKVTLME